MPSPPTTACRETLKRTRGSGGKSGSGGAVGLISGQPRRINPCWDVNAVLTNNRTGEVPDRGLYHADPVK